MLLSVARTYSRDYVRNGTDTTAYPDATVDRGLFTLGARFCRRTKYLTSSGTANIATTGLVTSPITRVQLLSVLKAGLATPLEMVSYEQLYERKTNVDTERNLIAFTSTTAAEVYPAPSATTVATFLYWQAFTSWTFGTADAVTLDLPDAIWAEIIPYGIPALLNKAEPENAFLSSPSWQEYLKIEASYAGTGSGVKKLIRHKSSEV